MDPMARRLQRRFVLLATLAMGVVMLVLCVGLNLFSFWSQYDQSMHALEYLSLNGGQLPETPPSSGTAPLRRSPPSGPRKPVISCATARSGWTRRKTPPLS